jgi:microcystin-dependent protein
VAENASVVDGTVTWTVRKTGSGGGEAIGVIKAFAGNGDIPSGYLLCDGSAVSRTMFPDLFAAIGTTYGAGDGSTTFNVPDYNTAERFAQGSMVAGTVKQPGLPNITGTFNADHYPQPAYATGAFERLDSTVTARNTSTSSGTLSDDMHFDASKSNPIYGASDTVQPNALTVRYIIKAFDGQTADSALIDITQYAQELAGKANITGSNMVYHKDVITTSGTYTAPATALYKITVKGGGGGGSGGSIGTNKRIGGGSGAEGGSTIVYAHLTAGETAAVVVGAGGSGGAAGSNETVNAGTNGGDSSVTIDGTTYTGGGGGGGTSLGSAGGSGTITGASGAQSVALPSGNAFGASGAGAGGGVLTGLSTGTDGTQGGGGHGGSATHSGTAYAGGAGGDGYCWFEYYTPGA